MDFIACGLRNFSISDYSSPIEIKNNGELVFYLLYEERELLNIVHSYNYSVRFGLDAVSRLCDSVVCYGQHNPSITDPSKRRFEVSKFFVACQTFSNALWFIKDNSVTPYVVTLSSDSEIEPESLRRNVYYSDSETKYDERISFTTSEINDAIQWYGYIEKLLFKKKVEDIKIDNNASMVNMSSFLSFEIPSFQRAFYFLDVARKMDFLPSKIANYISVLECLFAVSGENTHKTAERAATFIGKNNEERIKIFKDVINTYSVRSKYVHGSEIKNNIHDTLPRTSQMIDNIVRRVMIKMLKYHPELNYRNKKSADFNRSEEVNEWFNNLVLSKG
ncbi:hypothetical protein COL81_27085 [Bacillus toyonensis]|uniref:HEPN domain-containing protein n=1 Tax=Bacillus cereus group TaxID=86661 RepID=UPI000BED786B|nr:MULTISPECIES: HEPN domain-containing protein [Bacillus cereus group]PEA32997.1 hypothetical protein COO13_11985 [Bacillus toyonensis]PFA84006.1 hypothetical protein CN400_16495 [Bacillus thuringiensis]PGA33338.1 hypothetical protein COL81_27085 [Bacillus toyonensis]